MSDLIQVSVSGLAQGAIYALVALGLTVVYRSTTVMNFMHSENFMLGAFITLIMVTIWNIPMIIAMPAAVLGVFLVGFIVDKVGFEPLLNAPHISQVFATIAISFILKGVVRFFTVDERPLPSITGSTVLRFGDAVVRPQDILTASVLIVATLLLAFLFWRTHIGLIMRAGTQSLRGCALVGIDVKRLFMLMWGVGGALGAIAGILAAPTLLVYPDMGGRSLMLGWAGMTLGGFGTFPGAIVGGVLVGLLEVAAGYYVSTTLGDVAGYATILVVLLVRPQGIFGSREVS